MTLLQLMLRYSICYYYYVRDVLKFFTSDVSNYPPATFKQCDFSMISSQINSLSFKPHLTISLTDCDVYLVHVIKILATDY